MKQAECSVISLIDLPNMKYVLRTDSHAIALALAAPQVDDWSDNTRFLVAACPGDARALGQACALADSPPSTISTAPDTYPARGETRKLTVSATSSGVAGRPNGRE